MTLPEGHPCFDRVVMNVDVPLSEALDRELTGYGVIVPQAGLLGEGAGNGVIRFVDGIPRSAKHTGSGRIGGEALADIAETGPYRVRLVETSHPFEASEDEAISPAAPAERLAGDAELARRTRELARGTFHGEPVDELDAVAAFLADEEKIETIREQATAEARRRAAEWGFDTTDRS